MQTHEIDSSGNFIQKKDQEENQNLDYNEFANNELNNHSFPETQPDFNNNQHSDFGQTDISSAFDAGIIQKKEAETETQEEEQTTIEETSSLSFAQSGDNNDETPKKSSSDENSGRNDISSAFNSQIFQPEPKEKSATTNKNTTGLPDNLKNGIETLSGFSMDDVKVHYNSDKPGKINALAYTQGSDIHVARGQEKHLPHESWHVIQQKQGRVNNGVQLKGSTKLNTDTSLEREADLMGQKALNLKNGGIQGSFGNFPTKKDKSGSDNPTSGIVSMAFPSGEVIQAKIIGTVKSDTHLRMDPNTDTQVGVKRKVFSGFSNLEKGESVFEVKNQDEDILAVDDERPEQEQVSFKRVNVLTGDSMGSEGYLKESKINTEAPYGNISDNELTISTYTTQLRNMPAKRSDSKGRILPGVLVRIIDNSGDIYVKIRVLSNSKGFKSADVGDEGYIKKAKSLKDINESLDELEAGDEYKETSVAKSFLSGIVDDEGNLQEAGEAVPRPELELAVPSAIPENASVEEYDQYTNQLETHKTYLKSQLESELVVKRALERATTALDSELTLPVSVKGELTRDAENKTAEVAADFDKEISTIAFRIMDIRNVDDKDNETKLTKIKELYKKGYEAWQKANDTLTLIKNTNPDENPVQKTTNRKAIDNALKSYNKGETFLGNLKETTKETATDMLLKPGSTYDMESVQNARITGSPAELGGGFEGGYRSVLMTGGTEGDFGKTTLQSEDSYETRGGTWFTDEEGNAKPLFGDYPDGWFSSDDGLTQNVATFFKESMLGKFWNPGNFELSSKGATFKVPKIWFLKPYPPLAQIEFPVPLFPGVGLSLVAKAKASAGLQSIFNLSWGDSFVSKKNAKQELKSLIGEIKKTESRIKLLAIDLREKKGNDNDIQEIKKSFKSEKVSLNSLIIKANKAHERATIRDWDVEIAGKNSLSASIAGELFAGVMVGVPVVNISGGLYGELAASAKADIGFRGKFGEKNGEKFLELADTFELAGAIVAEVGAKISLNILFFSGDLAKFKFSDWTIASFALQGEFGKLSDDETLKIKKKEVKWFDKTRPPIEASVNKAEEKAETEQEKLVNASKGVLVKNSVGDDEEEQQTAFEEVEGLDRSRAQTLQQIDDIKAQISEFNEQHEDPTIEELEQLKTWQQQIIDLKKTANQQKQLLNTKLIPIEELKSKLLHEGTLQRSSTSKFEKDKKAIQEYLSLSYQLRGESQRQSRPLYKQYSEKLEELKEKKAKMDSLTPTQKDYYKLEQQVNSDTNSKNRIEREKKDLEKEKKKISNESDTKWYKSTTQGFKEERQKRVNAKQEQIDKLDIQLERVNGYIDDNSKKMKVLEKKYSLSIKAFKEIHKAYKTAEAEFDKIKETVGDVQSLMVRAQGHVDKATDMLKKHEELRKKLEKIPKLRQHADSDSETIMEDIKERQSTETKIDIKHAQANPLHQTLNNRITEFTNRIAGLPQKYKGKTPGILNQAKELFEKGKTGHWAYESDFSQSNLLLDDLEQKIGQAEDLELDEKRQEYLSGIKDEVEREKARKQIENYDIQRMRGMK